MSLLASSQTAISRSIRGNVVCLIIEEKQASIQYSPLYIGIIIDYKKFQLHFNYIFMSEIDLIKHLRTMEGLIVFKSISITNISHVKGIKSYFTMIFYHRPNLTKSKKL